VVVLSATDDIEIVREAIDLGAMGFISKRSATGLIVNALRQVLGGGVYVPPQALAALAPPTAFKSVATGTGDAGESLAVLRQLGITARQADVLGLLVQGKPTKVIARELDLAENTVKSHVGSILRSLNAANRTQALFALSRMGVKLPALISAGERPAHASH